MITAEPIDLVRRTVREQDRPERVSDPSVLAMVIDLVDEGEGGSEQ